MLIIYQGAHAYVSSSWYEKENVPTWNYQAVHLYGEATVLNEQETIDGLKTLLTKYEQNRENQFYGIILQKIRKCRPRQSLDLKSK